MSRIDENGDSSAVPARTQGDIVRTVFRHKLHRIRIRITFAELQRSFGSFFVTAVVNTNEGLHREAVIAVDREDLNDPWRGRSWLDNGEDPVRCRVHHSLDYENNVAVIGFPRSCLSGPRWVRVAADVVMYPRQQSAGQPYYSYWDNALQRDGDMYTQAPYSARILRG